MKFNPQLNKDITQLKKLSKLINKKRYLTFKQSLAVKYDVTIRTIENYMNKRTPGTRKSRNDAGKIRKPVLPREKKIAKELISAGVDLKDCKKIIEKETGKKVTDRKLENIRKKVEPELSNMNIVELPETKEAEPSSFGDKAKEMFQKLFDLDLVAPGYGIKIRVNGRVFSVPKEDTDDICLILANAYNRTAGSTFKVDREQLLRQRLFHLVEQQIRLAVTDRLNSKEVESMIRQFKNLQQDIELDANIRTVEKICKELKPDITWSEIGALIKKHTDEI